MKRIAGIILFICLLPLGTTAGPVADSLYTKAEHYFLKGNYALMLEHTLKALKLAEKGGCYEKALAYLKAGRAYYFLQQKETALQYFLMLKELPESCPIDTFRRTGYRFTGAVYFELQKRDSAIIWLERAERMMVHTNNYAELSSLYATLGEVYIPVEKKKKCFALALEYAIKSGDTVKMAFANIKQGILADMNKDCKQAEVYYKRALQQYRKVGMAEGEMYGLTMLAHSYDRCGRPREGFKLLINRQRIRDSIFKAETAEQTAHYRTLYETERKEKENAELAKQNTQKELEIAHQIKNRRMLVAGFMIFTLVLLIAFLYAYSKYKLKKQKETDRQMAEQQQLRFAAVIEAEEKERKRIAGDLHDGIGQTMSAAKINLSMLQNELPFASEEQRSAYEKITSLVDEGCKELRSVSHSMMPNALLKSGLANAIRNFINRIDHRVLSVDFYTEGLEESLDVNKEVVLYRIIQECVNNVIKHAGASKLHLSLIKDEEGISVVIEDNGSGFAEHSAEQAEGIGMSNIRSRIAYLKGTVEWDTAPGRGTAVIINIPDVYAEGNA